MTVKILVILACVPLYIVNSFCDKYVSALDENKHNIVYNSVKFLICALFLLPMFFAEQGAKFTAGAVACGILCGIMYSISKTIILKGYEKTSIAFMTLCHASGMIIPCVVGHFFWNERLSGLSAAGILVVVMSIVLIKDGKSDKKQFDLLGILIGAAVFLTSGGVMIAQKLMGLYFTDESVTAYNLYSFVIAFLILVLFSKPKNPQKKMLKPIALPAVGSALSLCIISLVMTKLAGDIPSVILFPLYNGLGIIFVCISSIFAFGEKLTPKKIAGLVGGVCGLYMINL